MKEKELTAQGHRATQVWSVLVFAARHQEIITYATIEKLTGLHRTNVGPYLTLIHHYCAKKNHPLLWSIAVNEKTGFPGKVGMEDRSKLKILCSQRNVFAFNWFSHDCPHPDDFK
jgi:hypothetical protein